MEFKKEETSRGFKVIEFKDRYDNSCSIQKSSLALEEAIWIGIDDPKIIINDGEILGKYVEMKKPENMSVFGRMHLTQNQVKDLLPILNHFVETGNLPDVDGVMSLFSR